MPLEELFGYIMLLTIIVLSVFLAARFVKHMGEKIDKTLISILSCLILAVYAVLGLLIVVICKFVGIENESVQVAIFWISIVSLTIVADIGLKKIYQK